MDYDLYVQTMRNLLKYPAGGADSSAFNLMIANMIDYAELRIYRELDFLSSVTSSNQLLTSGSRDVTTPDGMIVVQSANVVTPASTLPDAGTRVPLERVSIDVINSFYPSASTTGVPERYALLTDTAVRLGPTPGAAYHIEFIGTQRPDRLSADNTRTFISINMPDLLTAASMIYGTGMQRDFGAQADDPRMAVSWSKVYDDLKAGVQIEELRRKAESVGWGPYQPAPVANMPRDRNAAS